MSYLSSGRELEVYKAAYALALFIHKTASQFPKSEQYELGSQIRRASKSICLNISEGFAKQSESKAEFRRFLTIAIGSTEEVMTCTDFCHDLQLVKERVAEEWLKELNKIKGMLVKLRESLR